MHVLKMFLRQMVACACVLVFLKGFASPGFAKEALSKYQYDFDGIQVLNAEADEPRLKGVSLKKALNYLEAGATVWTKERQCISCHTNGSYLFLRPALTPVAGKPSEEIHQFNLDRLEHYLSQSEEQLHKGVTPTAITYLAAGLAQWDAHVTGELSGKTKEALAFMFRVQQADGSYGNQSCWPPFESNDFHGATIAAMGVAAAPGYRDTLEGETKDAYQKLLRFLKEFEPIHDYAQMQKLWVATRVEGLMTAEQKKQVIQMIFDHQQEDGGWSIRTFAEPEAWGSGNREEKLRAEENFDHPASDGHQTGFAIVVLCDAGVPGDDPRIQQGVEWITRNQRQSGRWWTRSLNNDKFHFITYSGTCFPLLALAKTEQIPSD